MQWVKQEDSNGCLLACLAMLTGQTYAQVRKDFPCYANETLCLETHGNDYLTAKGFAVARQYPFYSPARQPRSEWPPVPFAEAHVCCVEAGSQVGAHAVVMLGDGTVLDPATPQAKSLADYPKVWHVAAVVSYGTSLREGNACGAQS